MWCVCSALGIIEKIQQLPYQLTHHIKQRYLCSSTNHFVSQGYNCGFRNLQMLLSCLIKDAAYLRHVFNGMCGLLLLPTAWNRYLVLTTKCVNFAITKVAQSEVLWCGMDCFFIFLLLFDYFTFLPVTDAVLHKEWEKVNLHRFDLLCIGCSCICLLMDIFNCLLDW